MSFSVGDVVSPAAQGRANQACKRCHTRKKRCDRALPQCEGCRISNEQCSFQEQAEESGVFPVAYVRGLEMRVRQLEEQTEQLSRVVSSASSSDARANGQFQTSLQASGSNAFQKTEGNSLESELKDLSLEATAERYLGQSSGLSFARLTQAVLRRLRPDQYPFTLEHTSPDSQRAIGIEVDSTAGKKSEDLNIYANEILDVVSVIDKEHADYLAECYWTHSHTLYPFIQKMEFLDKLKRMYTAPRDRDLLSRSWLYTMWMVLAIGSTSKSSVMVDDESESTRYFDRAMEHFESALGLGATAALSAVLLQVSYSFFNKVGPNTWYLVGVGVRIAVGIGLHIAPASAMKQLPVDVQEYRKRLFFSLYMMDRLISVSLGRPFGIQDRDIEIECFAGIDDENIRPDMIIPQSQLRPSAIAVPLHIFNLRRICGRIFEQVYSNQNAQLSAPERDAILQGLHQELIEWRRDMPWPLPQSNVFPIPHFSTAWYDLNYYQHVLMLYRPSPLFPVLTLEKVSLIADASTMFINQVAILQKQSRYAFNWLNLFAVFTATLTLIYSVIAQPESLQTYLQRTNALEDLKTVAGFLATFGRKFPSALKCRDIVEDIMHRLEMLLASDASQDTQTQQQNERTSLTAGTPAKSSEASVDPGDEADSSYPVYTTGNIPYDDLQERVRRLESPIRQRDHAEFLSPFATPATDPNAGLDFGFSATHFGTAAAQLIAGGLGTSAEMDMDEEIMQFLGATSDAWGR